MSTFGRQKGARSASPLRSTSPGNSLRRSGSFGKSGRSLAASLDTTTASKRHTRSSTADMGNIENEYIRNLQQQVYFLELEANYLRDQSRKATVIPPRVTEEADRMMRKLRDLQAQLDDRSGELSRRESKILMLEAEKDTAIKRLRDGEEEYAAEKRQLVNELVSLKKLRDMSERDSSRKHLQAQQFKVEAEKGLTSLQEADRRIQTYRAELDRKSEDHSTLRIELEEKRAECLRLKTQLQEMDDRFFDSQAKTKEQLSRELREEIRQLRLQLKEKEVTAEQDRSLRNKVQDDCTALIKENAALAAQVIELQKHIDMDRAHRDEKDVRRHANIQDLVSTKENEKHLKLELEKVRELLRLEQASHREALDKLSREEQSNLEANLRRTQLRNELSEVEMIQNTTTHENVSLNRDRMLLSDEITSLRAKMDDKEDELEGMRLRLEEAEARNAQLEGKVRMQRNLESVKWEEFEKLATTMKAFSRNMGPTGKTEMEYD